VAFSTPFQMFKRYSQFAGGTCDPLVIHWPKGMKARGEMRHQYHHSTDIVPTIMEAIGLEMPTVYRGVEQCPLNGVSMRHSFDDANDHQEAAVLLDARHPRHLAGRLEGRRTARADQRQGPLRPGPLGALPRR
jgi:arylsulfatase